MSRLTQVIARLEAFDPAGALDAALAQWAVAPAPELEPLVVDLARLARASADPIAQTRERHPHQAWLVVAQRKSPNELSWLLETFGDNPTGLFLGPRRAQTIEKVAALSHFPPDPRLAKFAQLQLESALIKTAEAQVQLATLLVNAKHATASATLRVHLETHRALRRAFEPVMALAEDRHERPCTSAEVSTVAALIAKNGARAVPGRQTLEALYAAVYANPDDDGPRQVLADALIEANDVRGDYVALHFNPKKAAAARKLLERLRPGWLAPWRDFIAIDQVEFDRGFPSAAIFIDSPVLDRSMRTLRSVIVSCPDASFLTRDALAGVRSVEVTAPSLAQVFRRQSTPLPWRVLTLSSGDDATAAEVLTALEAGLVPCLESLVLDGLGERAAKAGARFVEHFRGSLSLSFTSAAACGSMVAAALGAKAKLAFSCREASLKGRVDGRVLSLKLASRAPVVSQRQFIEALPPRFERAEVEWPDERVVTFTDAAALLQAMRTPPAGESP